MGVQLKAVIFDYGNVLCLPQTRGNLEAMGAVLGISAVDFEPHYWRHRAAYDAARMDAFDYWRVIAEEAGRVPASSGIEALRKLDIESWSRPSPVMLNWVNVVRAAGFKTAVLSNLPFDLRQFLTAEVPWFPAFDHETFSCDLGVCKPEAAIYRHCLDGLGVQPDQALFIDDRAENIEGARRLGIHTHQFTTAADLADALAGASDLPMPVEG